MREAGEAHVVSAAVLSDFELRLKRLPERALPQTVRFGGRPITVLSIYGLRWRA
jgi:hypothetical protein